MNFNISKNALSAIFVQSAPARARNSAIATAIFLVLAFAGFVQAAGDAQWQAQTKQVNDSLRQMRQHAQGVPEAMQYVNQAENLWKQVQGQWAMQQRYQQQSSMNQMREQLLAQQKSLMDQLTKQQQFLQQQSEYLNTPLKKRMDQDNLQHFGRLLQPDMNAKGGPGWKVWEEAMRQLDSIGISSTSSSSSTSPVASSKATDKGGAYDKPLAKDTVSNPYANDPNVVDLRESKTLTPMLLTGPDALGGGPFTSNDKKTLEKDREERKANQPTIAKLEELAKQEGWSSEEQARLSKALKDLGVDGDRNKPLDDLKNAWNDIENRGKDENLDLAKKASQGDGPVLSGAGKQTQYNDCVVFAAATAAGVPYSIAAANANEIVRKAEGYENSQPVIEKNGLFAGEVVMLAERLGQAEVVPSSDFARVLKDNSPVMVAVKLYFEKDGNPASAKHQVVLSKVFQNGNDTMYEMINSNAGPQQRFYLTEKQLQTVICEKGIIVRPDPGTIVPLLR